MATLAPFPGPSVRQMAGETFAQVPRLRSEGSQLKLGALQELRNKRERLVQMLVAVREREEAKKEREDAKRRQRNVAIGTGVAAGAGGLVGGVGLIGPGGATAALQGAGAGAGIGSGIGRMFSGDPAGGAQTLASGLGRFGEVADDMPNRWGSGGSLQELARNYPPGPNPADYSFTFGG